MVLPPNLIRVTIVSIYVIFLFSIFSSNAGNIGWFIGLSILRCKLEGGHYPGILGASSLPSGLRDPNNSAATRAHGYRELVTGHDGFALAIESSGIGGVVAKYLRLPCSRTQEGESALHREHRFIAEAVFDY